MKRYVLIHYNERDKELYDLRKDPWQRENQYESVALSDVRIALNDKLLVACQPRTPGVVLDGD
jgi:hypothetical protein